MAKPKRAATVPKKPTSKKTEPAKKKPARLPDELTSLMTELAKRKKKFEIRIEPDLLRSTTYGNTKRCDDGGQYCSGG